jgi:AhpD family alkylhydroperoxidase
MKPRMNDFAAAPDALHLMVDFSKKVEALGLEPSLREPVKSRSSQLNGCAFCIHLHTREARAHGETEERIYLLDGWRESPLYTERERAALGWTEALTLISTTCAGGASPLAPDEPRRRAGRRGRARPHGDAPVPGRPEVRARPARGVRGDLASSAHHRDHGGR